MIDSHSLEPIGTLGKPHGVQGECNARLTVDLAALFEEEERLFLFFELDALLVPFRLIGYREKSSEVSLLRFVGIDSKEAMERYSGVPLLMEKQYLEDESLEFTWEHFIGFTVFDRDGSSVGTISDLDDSTLNTLLSITTPEGQEILLPVAEDLVVDMDVARRTLTLIIPDGLLQL